MLCVEHRVFAASTSDINISLLLPIFIMCSIMGEFSYECAKCGGHDQFDWESECVVKIGHGEDAIYLKGEYSGYGYVDAFVVTDGDKFVKFQTECISKGISLLEGYSKRKVTKYPKGWNPGAVRVELPDDVGGFVIHVHLEQFKQYHHVWHGGDKGYETDIVIGCILASDIYCCGDLEEICEAALAGRKPKKHEDDDREDEWTQMHRYCVPKSAHVKEYLLKSELINLPKVDFDISTCMMADCDLKDENGKNYFEHVKSSDKWKHQLNEMVKVGNDMHLFPWD